MSVALSIETFGPIFHVGWARASWIVTFFSCSVVLPRNGPPEQVRVMAAMDFGLCSWMSCQMAEASESRGRILPGSSRR